MNFFIRRFVLRILPLLYMALIWIQSSHFNPGSVENLSSYISMKIIVLVGTALELAHLFEFGLLYLLLIVAFLSFKRLNHGVEFIAVLISFSYGIVDEIHQSFVPFRSLSFVDLVKDAIGVFVMWLIVHKAYYSHRSNKIGLMLKGITDNSRKGGSDVSG